MQEIIKMCLKEANGKNYNIIDFIDATTFFIPFKKNHPHIIKQNNTHFLFYLKKDINFSDKLLDLVRIGKFEIFLESNIDDIFFDEDREFNLLKIKDNYSELFLHKKEDNINEIKKHYVVDNENGIILRQFDLLNTMCNLPIKSQKTEDGFFETYYYLSNEGKLSLSFHHRQDKPFEVIKKGFYTTIDYLVPHLKEQRTAFYKPSLVFFSNGKVIDFKYIVNKIDKTIEAKELLKKLNIINPEEHSFCDGEIKQFKTLFNLWVIYL